MPIDPFNAVNAMLRAEAVRNAAPAKFIRKAGAKSAADGGRDETAEVRRTNDRRGAADSRRRAASSS
jgi:hypothetical protein